MDRRTKGLLFEAFSIRTRGQTVDGETFEHGRKRTKKETQNKNPEINDMHVV